MGFTFGADAVLMNPEVSAYLAAISNAWALVEAHLANFIEYMVSEPILTDTNRAIDPLGMELFKEYKNVNQRLDLLKTILRLRLTPDEYAEIKDELQGLRGALLAAAEKRNDYIHSIYGYSEEQPDVLQKSKPYSLMVDILNPTFVGATTLEAVVRQISDTGETLQRFDSKVRRRKSKS